MKGVQSDGLEPAMIAQSLRPVIGLARFINALGNGRSLFVQLRHELKPIPLKLFYSMRGSNILTVT